MLNPLLLSKAEVLRIGHLNILGLEIPLPPCVCGGGGLLMIIIKRMSWWLSVINISSYLKGLKETFVTNKGASVK